MARAVTRIDGWIRLVILAPALGGVLTFTGSCRGTAPSTHDARAPTVLRVGVSLLTDNPTIGVTPLMQNLSLENLLRPGDDGRLQPGLAETWTTSPDGRTLTLNLRTGVTFHDGSPLDAAAVMAVFPESLKQQMGPLHTEIDHVRPVGSSAIEVTFRTPSPFLHEALEVPIQKGTAGTGPFKVVANSTEMVANANYYLGAPVLDRMQFVAYPSVRAAWADMLRDRVDMLYEVGFDALASMDQSTSVAVFSVLRRYQYMLILNTESPALRSRSVRQALNMAVDRDELIKTAMNGQGLASAGPISPQHWALQGEARTLPFRPKEAATVLASHQGAARAGRLRFTCLVPPDAVAERISLELKRQLQAVGVDLAVEQAPQGQIFERMAARHYDAVFMEGVSGPTLFRLYRFWRSRGSVNTGGYSNATVDHAFDRVRRAASERDYRDAVVGLHTAFMEDPPAVFLAWSVRARAVSKRFTVPAESNRDVLATLRLWKPAGTQTVSGTN